MDRQVRVQSPPAGRNYGCWYCRCHCGRFQSSPAARGGRNRRMSIAGAVFFSFNPRPGRGDRRARAVSILTRRTRRAQHFHRSPGRPLLTFQSSPAARGGRNNSRAWCRVHRINVSIFARRTRRAQPRAPFGVGGLVRVSILARRTRRAQPRAPGPFPDQAAVSILARRTRRAQHARPVADARPLAVSILARRTRRAQHALVGHAERQLERFNPRPPHAAGATREAADFGS